MHLPTAECAKITIELLELYKDEESINSIIKNGTRSVTSEEVLQKFFKEKEIPGKKQIEIAEFFYRVLKYRKFFSIIVKEFFYSKPLHYSGKPVQSSLYSVYLYLLIFLTNPFTKSYIEELLLEINDKKALVLLSYLKRSDIIIKLYEWGCRIWEDEFVKSLLENVIREPLFKDIYDSIFSKIQKLKDSQIKPLTIPVGPSMMSRPRKVLTPKSGSITPPITRIPIRIRAREIPKSVYLGPIRIETIEEIRLRHRLRAKKLFEEAQMYAFRCSQAEKSERYREIIEKIEKERYPPPLEKKPWKKFVVTKDIPPPKKTATVILREGARLLKLEQAEIKRYEDIASGGYNGDWIGDWEEEIREQNYRQHIEDIEKKHLEGLLSYEEALIAKQKCLKSKKEKADQFRKEREQFLKQLDEWKKVEQLKLQEIIERGKAIGRGARDAKEQLKEEKHKLVLEAMEESKILRDKWLSEKQQDLLRKIQIIKQIKALQALGLVRRKNNDLSETANLGLLCEMSITELKERLFILRVEIQQEVERRKAENKMRRECRKDIIESYEELIRNHERFAQEKKKVSKFVQEEKEKERRREIKRSSSCLEDLRRKLCEKRRERRKQKF